MVVPEGRTLAERARLSRDGESLRVTLESPEGTVVGTRDLPGDAQCTELASAAAAVLASWLGDTYPELVAPLPEDGPTPETSPPPAPPDARVRPPPAPRPRAPGPRAQSVAPVAIEASDAARPARYHLAPSVGLGAAVTSAGAVPVGSFALAWLPERSGLGWSLGVALSGRQEQRLGPGVVRWSRWPAMVGPVLHLSGTRLRAEAGLGGAIGWLRLTGHGFDRNQETADVAYAALATLRLSAHSEQLQPFVGATGLLWAKRATATVSGPRTVEADLPPLEFWLLAGLAVQP